MSDLDVTIKTLTGDTLFISTQKGSWTVGMGDIRHIAAGETTGVIYPVNHVRVWLKDNSSFNLEFATLIAAQQTHTSIVGIWSTWLGHQKIYENSSEHPGTRLLENKRVAISWGGSTLFVDPKKIIGIKSSHGYLDIDQGNDGCLRLTSSKKDYLDSLATSLTIHAGK